MAEMQAPHHSWDALNVIEQSSETQGESPKKRLKRDRTESQFDMETIMKSMASKTSKPPRLAVHHVVLCYREIENGHDHAGHPSSATYLDIPRMFAKDSRAAVLRGQEQVFDVNTYLHQNDDICMIVCKQYSCQDYHQTIHSDFVKYPVPSWIQSMGPYDTRPWFYFLLLDAAFAEPVNEYITVCSDILKNALVNLDRLIPKADAGGQFLDNLVSPYNYIYHQRIKIHAMAKSLPPAEEKLFMVMLDYFDGSQNADFEEADELFNRGMVNAKHFSRLFKRNDIVVREEERELRAYLVDSVDHVDYDHGSVELSCWTWEFDGRFYKSTSELSVSKPPDDEEISISDLGIWPLRYSSSGVRESLENRGKMFWSLREKKLVSYEAPIIEDFEIRTSNPKYMVDMMAYREMNPEHTSSPNLDRELLDASLMASNTPPDDPFVLLLPFRIKGFGFHDKKWRNLRVANMRPGDSWNTKAFERLVLEPSKKELIQALVTVHLKTVAPSDVIEDKGAGLIVLLHGPPGTGKTLTAESVAALAGKPLYRITCGDMGTDPERVEKYLESSLYVGTMWGCVVLLDEADVFLEARTQTDLVRNALVSVFLRVLEYYEGILILTSNRVGTFDEAFKSRMQLAVHYPTLGKRERTKIWQNFIEALEEAEVPINKDEIRWEVDRLAEQELNGRQIRNTIKTARQLAAHKKEAVLQVSHLEHVIKVANEFERYIVETRGHTDDQFARDARWRA